MYFVCPGRDLRQLEYVSYCIMTKNGNLVNVDGLNLKYFWQISNKKYCIESKLQYVLGWLVIVFCSSILPVQFK